MPSVPYSPLPAALVDDLTVCGRCLAAVVACHQPLHDRWHEELGAVAALRATLEKMTSADWLRQQARIHGTRWPF